jgi:hypothetical protein
MFVDFNILNQLGSPSINSNTFANRPAAGQTGRLFVSTDTFEIYRDNGTGWDLIGGPGAGTITGTGTATQVAYFTGAQTIGSSANLFWDNTAGALGINTATPGAELDVHGTGTIVQVNATGATSNAYLAFQRTGTGVWRIGDTYNGGSNFFELHNTVLTIDALEFEAATNKSTFLAQQTYASGLATGNQFTYNLTVPNGVNITSPNAVGAVNSYLNLSLGGNTTVPAGARQGLEGNSRISFTGAGTLTMTQAATVRAFSALSSVYSFAGSAVGTVTHLAGLRICFPDNIGSAINITNNYGLLLNDQTAGLGTVTYTNRWGIYQEGASDLNYFNGNLLVKTTTNAGFALDINGTGRAGTTFEIGSSTTWQRLNNSSITYFSSGSYSNTLTSNAPGGLNFVNNTNGQTTFSFSSGATLRINTIYSGAVAGVTFAQLALDSSFYGISTTTPAITNRVFTNSGSGVTVQRLNLYNGDSGKIEMQPTGGNVLIGTTTDAGFRLDCNGTARVQGNFNLNGTTLTNTFNTGTISISNNGQGNISLGATNNQLNYSGNFKFGSNNNDASAIVEIASTTRGFLPPRMTGAQAEAIATPAAGLMVYANNGNGVTITSTGWWGYDGATWVKLN